MSSGSQETDELTAAPTVSRRSALQRLAHVAGTAAAGAALSPFANFAGASAAIVPEGERRLNIARVSYDSPYGRMKAYSARLRGADKQPSVLVVHDFWGLTPHMEDIARRLAIEGFYAMAVDALSPVGGTPPNGGKTRASISRLDPARTLAALKAGLAWLKSNLNTTEKVGAVGFGWGGGMVNRLAVNGRDLTAGVVYYGPPPALDQVSRIGAALLLHYAGKDPAVDATVPAFGAALDAAGVRHEIFRYAGTRPGFANDMRAALYDRPAAELAWTRTVGFLRKNLA